MTELRRIDGTLIGSGDCTMREIVERNKANLHYADLRHADLGHADLRNANLRGADLRGVNLENADLGNADLRGADLENADLENANLRGADLRHADLRHADLRDADLDFSTLPLHCGGTQMVVCNRYIGQVAYHLTRVDYSSCTPEVIKELDRIKKGPLGNLFSNYRDDLTGV